MPISNLSFTHFRNLNNAKLSFHKSLNFFYGLNGSGKTSVLEAIYLISTGRSFKSRSVHAIINRDCGSNEFILFANLLDDVHNHAIGIKKSSLQPTVIKVNKEAIRSASKLAKLSPTILIDPLSFDLLTGSPGRRRQFMDWGVFHVEPFFSAQWNNYLNCLKQRNSLLRGVRIDAIALNIWNKKLVEFGELVHGERQRYFEAFEARLNQFLHYFSLNENIKINYYRGWDKSKSLAEIIEANTAKDIERGFTQTGPHRADIKVTLFGQLAQETLSRGQQKLFIFAMYLAQMQTLLETKNKNTVVLIDDVSAELDEHNLQLVFTKLLSLDAQIMVTSLSQTVLKSIQQDSRNYKMFHVEHGGFTVFDKTIDKVVDDNLGARPNE